MKRPPQVRYKNLFPSVVSLMIDPPAPEEESPAGEAAAVRELKPLDPAAFAGYVIHDRREILQLLHALIHKRVLITARLDTGPSFLTLVLAITADETTIVLDATSDDTVNGWVANAAELVCMTRLDKVRVQFSLQTPACIEHDGRAAIGAALPESVLRLQRREFFRLEAPAFAAPTCTITTTAPDGRGKPVSVTVLDVSSGGLAILLPPDAPSFAPGAGFDDCVLHLPDEGPLPVRLLVRSVLDVRGPDGEPFRRAGCEFVDQRNTAAARIQRYIFKVERDRKARESGY